MKKKYLTISASPKARKFARELGADLHLIEGSQREGRINEDDIKKFIKESLSGKVDFKKKEPKTQEYDHSDFGEIDKQDIPRIKKIAGPHLQNHGERFRTLHSMMRLILQRWNF